MSPGIPSPTPTRTPMTRRHPLSPRAALLLLALLSGAGCSARGASTATPTDGPLRVMAFNIRYAHTTPPDLWPDRLPVLTALLRHHAPDLVGTQEALYHQLLDIEAALPEYRWVGLGRLGGSRGEFMGVFYRHDRLVPLEYDHYWLSDTPEVVGSTTWGNQIPRMATWVRFRDRASGREFVFVNTHFDHQSQPSRERSAELVARHASRWGPEVPVILVGDFNAAAGTNPAYQHLVGPGGFRDSWPASQPDTLGTFHGFQGLPEAARRRDRIDWILTRGPATALDTEIVTFQQGGQWPSDHFPVMARVEVR